MRPVLAQEFSTELEAAWSRAAAVVPKVVAFLAILVIGALVALALRAAVNALLEQVGFDRAVERGGVRRALARTPYDASDVLARIVFWAVLLFTLQLAFAVFGPNAVSDLLAGLVAYLPRVFAAVLIVVIAAALAGFVRELIDVAIGGLSWGRTVATVAGGAVLAVGIFAALTQLQIAPAIVVGLFYAILAALVGIAVVAVGGGGIVPLRARWERALERWDEERKSVRHELDGAGERIAAHRAARASAQPATTPATTPGTAPYEQAPPTSTSGPVVPALPAALIPGGRRAAEQASPPPEEEVPPAPPSRPAHAYDPYDQPTHDPHDRPAHDPHDQPAHDPHDRPAHDPDAIEPRPRGAASRDPSLDPADAFEEYREATAPPDADQRDGTRVIEQPPTRQIPRPDRPVTPGRPGENPGPEADLDDRIPPDPPRDDPYGGPPRR